jgi:hypothetical protein
VSRTLAARACVLSGLLVAALLAPKDSYFLPNLAYLWLPQLAILLLAWFSHANRLAALAGTALAMAVYLAAFGAWLLSRPHSEALAWLGYLFSLPGAAFGVLMAAAVCGKVAPSGRMLAVASTFAVAVSIGIILNQGVVCATVLHCSLR